METQLLNVITTFNKNKSTAIKNYGKILNSHVALCRCFHYHSSDLLADVLVKVSLLNSLYSTNILNTFAVAKHIVDIDFSKRVLFGNEDQKCELVHDVAKVTINGKLRNNYSFATKYCSFIKPHFFPIYDKYIKESLFYFNHLDQFTNKFIEADLKDFKTFKKIMTAFTNHNDLQSVPLPIIDKFLWFNGKAILEGRPVLSPSEVFEHMEDKDKLLVDQYLL